jgi:DNA-binding GntR family transcriptional regulator
MLEAMQLKDEARVEQLVRRHILRGKDIVIEQIKNAKMQL